MHQLPPRFAGFASPGVFKDMLNRFFLFYYSGN